MKKVLLFLKREFLEMLPPTIYFFIAFHLVLFIRSLMVEGYGVTVSSSFMATIGALVVGKSILIADALPLLRLFKKKREIFNIIWKILVYSAVVLLFQYLEEIIPLISKYDSISVAARHLSDELNWPRFWGIHIIYLILLVIYIVSTVIIDLIGRDEFIRTFIGPGQDPE